MSENEKITINMNVVDLGKIDLLVEQGFYSNRTDLIKTSIRNQLSSHSSVIDNVITVKSYEIGINYYDRETLEQVLEQNKQLDIKVVGMLVLKDDIEVELAKKTIKSLKVLGVFRASHELKIALKK
ncbi:CopG family transcriptional regulator [Oceanobacillus bengalensis]|uniref:CopG family transcriptional regulator n=1 Tax=Oceanobacillus bengalensis TaxID=1435466 RepID=A0A494YRY0_9BACI|nr:CopG family transcriptional regulator [Oceanobacillus bengalensis]RKQ12428.1 CopG family transcriptional regulator [Oceanobacillus bengalensis]